MVNGLKALFSERAIVSLEFTSVDVSYHLNTIKCLNADFTLGCDFNNSVWALALEFKLAIGIPNTKEET